MIRKPSQKRRDHTPAVVLENVGLSYETGPEFPGPPVLGPPVLMDVSFALNRGSFHFLTGLSGAGKSSLLRLLYLAQRPTSGSLQLFGKDVTGLSRHDLPGLRRRIGVVFQDFRLIDHLSAAENVALPLRIAGVSPAEIKRHVAELLTWVGLRDHMDALPATLSGGQKQRVAIARAVITRPELLLADEPTGNVDDAIGMRLLHLFVELNKLGSTVLIATHNEALVGRFSNPRLHLEKGRLFRVEQPTSILSDKLTRALKETRPGTAAGPQSASAQPASPESGPAPSHTLRRVPSRFDGGRS